jgi:hypothetical protein
MKGGPGKNKQEHYAGPSQGELPWKKIPPWKKPKPQLMKKGGSVKKRKGYKHGGVVHDMTNKPVEVAYTTAGSLKRAGIS